MVKYTKNGLLNFKDVNAWIAIYFPNFNFNNTIIIVYKNRIRHLINCLQAQNFALFYPRPYCFSCQAFSG